jgi:hypothetical protein
MIWGVAIRLLGRKARSSLRGFCPRPATRVRRGRDRCRPVWPWWARLSRAPRPVWEGDGRCRLVLPLAGGVFTFWNHQICLAVVSVVILLFAVLFANVVEIPGTEPWLRQGAAGSLLVVAATALLGSPTAIGGTGLVRCQRNTSMWGGCPQ